MLWQLLDTWNPIIYWTIQYVLRNETPNIVHTHKLRGLSPAVWSAVRAGQSCPIIHTCHDYEIISPEGQLITRIGKLAQAGSGLLWPYQALRRKASETVNAVTAPSAYVLDLHQRLGFFTSALKKVIPNPHNMLSPISETLPQEPYEKDTFRILFIGRLENIKGPAILAEAIQDMEGVELEIAGWGNQDAELRKRFNGIKNIRFSGPVSGSAKTRAFNQCNLVAVPSIWQENFPVVIAEAYSSGKPVLASAIGGITEIVEDGKTGWLVEPGNVNAWREAITRILGKNDLLKEMRPACLARAKQYTPENVTELYFELYHSVLP